MTFKLYGLHRRIKIVEHGRSKFILLLGQNGSGKTLLLKHLSSGKFLYRHEIDLNSKFPIALADISKYGGDRVTYIYQDANEQFLGFSSEDELYLLEKNYEVFASEELPIPDEGIVSKSFEELSDGNKQYANVITGLRRISDVVIMDEFDDYVDLSKVDWITSNLNANVRVKHVVISTHQREIYRHLDPAIFKLERIGSDRHLESLFSLYEGVQHVVDTRTKMISSIEMKEVNFGYWEQMVLASYSRSFQGPGYHEILGRNGSGKSTVLRILSKQYRPNKGIVEHCPKRIKVFHLPQRSDAFFLNQSLSEEADMYGIDKMETIPLNEFSKGQRKIIAILLSLAAEADVYLIDEPFEGISNDWRSRLADLSQELSRRRLLIVTKLDKSEEVK